MSFTAISEYGFSRNSGGSESDEDVDPELCGVRLLSSSCGADGGRKSKELIEEGGVISCGISMFAPKAAELVADSCTVDVPMPGLVGCNKSLSLPVTAEVAGVVADASADFATSTFVDDRSAIGCDEFSCFVASPGLVHGPFPTDVS